MKFSKFKIGILILTLGLCLSGLSPTLIFATSPPTLAVPIGLSFAEIKITGNEFVMLQNNSGTNIADLSAYWLYDFNNTNPLASGVSSSSQQLPAASLADGQTILLSANGGSTCGAAVTNKLSISLTDSGGFLEVVQQSLAGGVLVQTAGDAVSWSSGVNSTAGMISSVPSSSSAPNAAYYRYQNSISSPAYLWQRSDVDTSNSCQLNVTVSSTTTPGPVNPGNQLLPGAPPPAQIITLAVNPSTSTSFPAADVGLKSPQINELLPNPASPQTDAAGEFIELYNSNPVSFDLSNFVLQVGTTVKHKYTFPAGVKLAASSFTAYLLGNTGLSLSNSGGQAVLLDPNGNAISKTAVYTTAKDGLAWALADGKWYWTSSPTPSAENVINQPGTSSSKTQTSSKPQVLGASTTGQTSNSNSTSSASGGGSNPAPLHAWTLAGVGALAVLYALYEYRQDLANNLHRLRRYRAARAAAGTKPAGRGGARTARRLGWWQNHLRTRANGWLKKFRKSI